MSDWRKLHNLATIASEWVTVFLERWQDASGAEYDYWRAERPDSVIAISTQGQFLLVPKPTFRPGVGRLTLDFPGGRIPEGKAPADTVPAILARELDIPAGAISAIDAINNSGWPIDSSFSNARLWGFHATVDPGFEMTQRTLGARVPLDQSGIAKLMEDLVCLQCRALLTEWLASRDSGKVNRHPG